MEVSPPYLSDETHWEKAAKTRMGKYLTGVETDFILKSIDPAKISMIVDIGAEAGRFSLMAANKQVTVVGIDIDGYSLRRLKMKNKDVTVIQADARKLPLRDRVFDAVFLIEVLDYIPELCEALSESHRVLKPESSVVLSFGNQASLKAKLRKLRGRSYMHSYGKVKECLHKTGLKVESKLGYSWLPFGRMSESRLVAFLAGIERLFFLRHIPSLSPWVILHARSSFKD